LQADLWCAPKSSACAQFSVRGYSATVKRKNKKK